MFNFSQYYSHYFQAATDITNGHAQSENIVQSATV